jgi:hypothetical protein
MVLVSNPKKFVFLKTRKTAGTSIEMMLEEYCAPPGHVVTESTKELETEYGLVGARMNKSGPTPKWRNHIGATPIAKHIGRDTFDEYLKLSSVRNPFSRTISQFYWQFVWQKREVPETFEENKSQFNDYIFSEMFKQDYHVVHAFNKFILDDAFRLEHLDEDFDRIGKRLGIPLSKAAMPKTKDNSGFKPDFNYIYFFTQKVVDEIRKKQRWVFDHFDYSEDPRDARL